MSQTYYPDFDVLVEQGAWDEYTRSIVRQRLRPPKSVILTEQESDILSAVLGHLLFEDRHEIVAFVVSYVDQRLRGRVGEGQRKPGVPPEAELIRLGLPFAHK